jgi:hypothetical protein
MELVLEPLRFIMHPLMQLYKFGIIFFCFFFNGGFFNCVLILDWGKRKNILPPKKKFNFFLKKLPPSDKKKCQMKNWIPN